jgi:hypothetical protein
VVLAALTTSPVAALAVGAIFGLVRGLAVYLTDSITTTAELLSFHRRLVAAAWRARALVIATEIGAAAVVAAALWLPAGALVVVGLGGLAIASRAAGPARRPVPIGPAEGG